MKPKMIFETKKGEVYEVECEVESVCRDDKCYTAFRFPDKRVFIEGNREALFQYLRDNYIPKDNRIKE